MFFYTFLPRFPKRALLAALSLGLLASCIHKKYETPITKNTQQPDKVLFDQAIHDIEHGRYEVARISLNTLMNTYESSEYLAKAKLAVADSWYPRRRRATAWRRPKPNIRISFFSIRTWKKRPQAQNRVCDDSLPADGQERPGLAANPARGNGVPRFAGAVSRTASSRRTRRRSCATSRRAWPNTNIVVGNFYWRREMNPAAANRLNALVDQYPLYSKAGEALYEAGDSYSKMGPRFRKHAGEMFGRVVRDYPLSVRAKEAKERLKDMELPVPAVNQAALEREKWEEANYHKPSMIHRPMGLDERRTRRKPRGEIGQSDHDGPEEDASGQYPSGE